MKLNMELLINIIRNSTPKAMRIYIVKLTVRIILCREKVFKIMRSRIIELL